MSICFLMEAGCLTSHMRLLIYEIAGQATGRLDVRG